MCRRLRLSRNSRRRKNAADTIFSDDSGRRARRKYDGAGAGCRLCVAFGTQGHSRRDRCGNQRTCGQGSSLHEGPVNTRSAHDVRLNRRGPGRLAPAPETDIALAPPAVGLDADVAQHMVTEVVKKAAVVRMKGPGEQLAQKTQHRRLPGGAGAWWPRLEQRGIPVKRSRA